MSSQSTVIPSKLSHIAELDGVRAIAALMVMFFHLPLPVDLYPWIGFVKRISVFGQTGVDLFFILSGFLITRILLNAKSSENYFGSFYMRRALRIFPLYYLFLFIFYATYGTIVASREEAVPISSILTYVFYAQNLQPFVSDQIVGPIHYWSLAVEEHFYLFWPLLVRVCSVRNIKFIIGGCIIGAPLLRWYAVHTGNLDYYHFTFTRIDSLAFGCLIATIEAERGFEKTGFKSAISIFFVGLILCGIAFVAGGASESSTLAVMKFTFIGLVYGGGIFALLTLPQENFVRRAMRWWPLCWIGGISYGLYVYHQWCYRVVDLSMPDLDWIVAIIMKFALALVVAAASFYFFEKQFLRLKAFFPMGRATRLSVD